MHQLRLTHPALDFHVDVRLRHLDGRWLAVADLAGTPEIGGGAEPWEALVRALLPLGRELAADLAAAGIVKLAEGRPPVG